VDCRGWAVGAAFWARGCTWGENLIATIVFFLFLGWVQPHPRAATWIRPAQMIEEGERRGASSSEM